MGRLNAIDPSQFTPIPTEAEGDRPQGIASAHDVLATGDTITLIAIDDLHTATLR